MTTHNFSRALSSRLYVRLKPSDTRLFRYLLDACDNLAYTSVVDRKGCILKVVFTPDMAKELRQTLRSMRQSCPFEILELPGASSTAHESCFEIKTQTRNLA
jgi:hypothetical protein